MAYALDVSEVGPAEYPLIGVLRDAVFGDFPHRFSNSLEEMLAGRQDVLALIAHLEGNPVGFAVGCRDNPNRYYLMLCGVLKEYRGQGLMTRMMQWHEGFAGSHGYRTLFFNTFNHFPEMLRFGLKRSFLPIGVEQTAEGDLAIRLAKPLEPQRAADAVPLQVRKPPRPIGNEQAQVEIEQSDAATLASALESGFVVTGMHRDPTSETLRVLLHRR